MAKLIMRCPCGNGYIVREVFRGVYEDEPKWCCHECENKYKFLIYKYLKPNPQTGLNSEVWIVPKDFDTNVKLDHTLKPIQPNKLTKEDFPNYAACNYDLSTLKNALKEAVECEDILCLRNEAGILYRKRQAYLRSNDIDELIQDLHDAIELYDLFPNNFDKLQAQEKQNQKILDEFNLRLKKSGILFKGKYFK